MKSQEYYALKDFYKSYYNGHQYRDVVYKKIPTVKNDGAAITLKYNPDDKMRPYEKFIKFLTSSMHRGSNGSLMATITHYPNYLTYQSKQEEDRLSDRLFFDFDIKTNESKRIAAELNNTYRNATGRERLRLIDAYRREYRKLILEDDLIRPVYDEVMRFIKVLQDDLKLHPYLTWSGSSGFHVNIFMPDQKLTYINYVRTKLHNVFKDKLNLKYQDDKVLDAISRKQRVPYSMNPKTALMVMPIPSDIGYDDLLSMMESNFKSNSISVDTDFNIEEYYANTDFIDMLHYLDNKGKAAAIHEREMAARNTKNVGKYKGNKIFKGMINISKPEDVMRLLSFQCFRNMEWSDYNNLLLVNLLWNTNLSTSAEVQEAMILYWKSKGTILKASSSGLKRVEANKSGKYAPTNNTMKRNDYCMGCKDWKQCFRYKLILSDEYKERIHAFKEKQS